MTELTKEIASTTYPGRGIIIGKSEDGKKAVIGYFIMGRSENSRNRVFVAEGTDLKTQAFDPSKLVDPSLIIYAPVRTLDNDTIVTNGDQTDTIRDFVLEGKTFEEALRTRTFEPDPPNFTPRISGMLTEPFSAITLILGGSAATYSEATVTSSSNPKASGWYVKEGDLYVRAVDTTPVVIGKDASDNDIYRTYYAKS